MNKDLKGDLYKIEPLILSTIKNALMLYPHSDGTERARELLQGTVNYNQLKKILHDMKSFKNNNETEKYQLCGGSSFESWGTTVLNNRRKNVKDNKKSSKNADSIGGTQGRSNPFLKKHTKNKKPMAPPKTNMTPNSKSNFASTLKLGKLFEEIMKSNI